MKIKLLVLLFIMPVIMSFAASAHEKEHHEKGMFSGLDTPAAKLVIAFHHALNTGDKITAKSLLADDVTIYEGGGVERSADEYAQHHMNSDMEYLSSVTNKALEHQVKVLGNTAISASRFLVNGMFKGEERDYQSMETIVLINTEGEWKIKHIHWSN